jgi:hypothetical protein
MLSLRRGRIALECRLPCRLYRGLVCLVSRGGVRGAGLAGGAVLGRLLLTGHGGVYLTVRCVCGVKGRNTPVNSLKAAGLSWSTEASMSMGVRHFWQYSPWGVLSLAMLLSARVPHALG